MRAIDLRYLERWAATRRKPALRHMGVDEIHLGKKGEIPDRGQQPGERRAAVVWTGAGRKKTLDGFFEKELNSRQRRGIEAACVDSVGYSFRQSIEQWAARTVASQGDKFHVMQHANRAVEEVRRAECFRKGGRMRGLVKGKRWLLLIRWVNLTAGKRRQLNELFALNRRLLVSFALKREPGQAMGLPLRRSYDAVLQGLAGSVAMATPEALSEAGRTCCWSTSTAS